MIVRYVRALSYPHAMLLLSSLDPPATYKTRQLLLKILGYIFRIREIIFVLIEMVGTYRHNLFLELKELKKYVVIMIKL